MAETGESTSLSRSFKPGSTPALQRQNLRCLFGQRIILVPQIQVFELGSIPPINSKCQVCQMGLDEILCPSWLDHMLLCIEPVWVQLVLQLRAVVLQPGVNRVLRTQCLGPQANNLHFLCLNPRGPPAPSDANRGRCASPL